MRLVEVTLTPEENRLLAAYRKKNGIDINKLMQMTPEEIESMKQDAVMNKHLYPIPVSEPGFLYHGTAKARLAGIRAEGLVPSTKSRWTKTTVGGLHSLGRIFFSPSLDKAEFYALAASRTSPILLRVREENVKNPKEDTQDDNCVFTTDQIPPDQIEMWNGKKWTKL